MELRANGEPTIDLPLNAARGAQRSESGATRPAQGWMLSGKLFR
jgi:hypothetical protein